MARKAHEIAIASETKAFKQGIDSGVIEPLEDAEKALDELGRSDGAEKLERGLRDAQKQTEDLKDETKETARVIERDFKDSYRDMKRSSDDATDAAKAGLDDVKDEAASTAKESAASFDGSAESIVDAFQEIAANAFAGFGPAGMLAGLAAAAGIGLAVKGFEDVDEATEESKQRVADWASNYEASVGDMITASEVFSNVQRIQSDRAEEVKKNAEDWGVSTSTALRAMAGDSTSLAAVESVLNDRRAEANRLLAEQEVQVDSNAGKAYDLADAVERGAKAYDQITTEMGLGAEQAKVTSDAMIGLVRDAGSATEQVDELGNRLYTLPDGKEIMIDAKTGRATDDISRFKGDLDGVPETVNTRLAVEADISRARNTIATLNGQRVYVTVDAQGRRGVPFT